MLEFLRDNFWLIIIPLVIIMGLLHWRIRVTEPYDPEAQQC